MDIFGNFSQLVHDKKHRKVNRSEDLDYIYTDLSLEGISKIEQKEQPISIFGVKSGIVLLFCILIFRLFFLQVVSGASNQRLAEGNRIRPRVIEAARGLITDKNGVWLARNKPNFALALNPSDLPKKKSDREAVYKQISDITSMSVDEIRGMAEKNGLFSLDYVDLVENISHDDALVMQKKIYGISGLSILNKSSREYSTIPGLSHLLGYTGLISPDEVKDDPSSDYYLSDRTGKTGLESQYEQELRGKHGVEQIEVDSKGNIVRVLVQDGQRQPVSGDNISLYMDTGLEQTTATALQNGINNAKEKTSTDVNAGVAIVMDVHTGGILSMVSLPDYNDNLFATKISNADYQSLVNDKSNPLFDRAIKGTYPPGSVSKIILASAGLMEGNITKNTAFSTPAAIKIGEYTFPDWKDHSYETTNIQRAIAESNNVFFYSVGGGFQNIQGLGMDKIDKWWSLFGLGERTGIDIPGEATGFLPTPAWKQKTQGVPWYIGDTYHVSIGQGDLLVTPLQMVRATAAIANGGTLLQPQLVQKITDSSGKVVQQFGPRVERQNFLSADVIKTVQDGMRLTVTDGSAKNMQDLPVQIAGKTGTAQFLDNQKTHAWFECYAPYNDPQIAVLVMIEGGGEGYDIAAPVAHEILNYYYTR